MYTFITFNLPLRHNSSSRILFYITFLEENLLRKNNVLFCITFWKRNLLNKILQTKYTSQLWVGKDYLKISKVVRCLCELWSLTWGQTASESRFLTRVVQGLPGPSKNRAFEGLSGSSKVPGGLQGPLIFEVPCGAVIWGPWGNPGQFSAPRLVRDKIQDQNKQYNTPLLFKINMSDRKQNVRLSL